MIIKILDFLIVLSVVINVVIWLSILVLEAISYFSVLGA